MNICFFFFNDPATTEIYTLPLHDALPILTVALARKARRPVRIANRVDEAMVTTRRHNMTATMRDRKSTRLNSQSRQYLVCRLLLEKKKKRNKSHHPRYVFIRAHNVCGICT